jgi:hypothetical protein
MARPIKETPILTGRDAVNFFQNMKDAKVKKATPDELSKIKTNAESLKKVEQTGQDKTAERNKTPEHIFEQHLDMLKMKESGGYSKRAVLQAFKTWNAQQASALQSENERLRKALEEIHEILERQRIESFSLKSHAGDYAEQILYNIIQEVEELKTNALKPKE